MRTEILAKVKSFIVKYQQKIIIGATATVAIGIVFGINAAIYSLLRLLFPHFICIPVAVFLVYRQVFLLCRYLTFPGTMLIAQRNFEFSSAREIAQNARTQIDNLIWFTEYISDTNPKKTLPGTIYAAAIRASIAYICYNYNRQEEHKTLNSKQAKLAAHYNLLQQLLKQAMVVQKISDSTTVSTLWTTLKKTINLRGPFEKVTLDFENQYVGKEIIDACKQIREILDDILKPKRFFPAIYRWLTNDILGSVDQTREELCAKYEGKPIKIPVAKKVILDCLLIPGRKGDARVRLNYYDQDESENLHESINISYRNEDKERFANPTIILCNPNGGLYEYMVYDTEWLEFYVSRGLNVFLWNYRGYGRSSGRPNTTNIKYDAEKIVKLLRSDFGIKKIGAHGESLGGLVACHLAKHAELDFVCAGRTFTSLPDVASYSFGSWVGKLYKYVTGWTDENSRNFVDAHCYKIITFDPKDGVIPYQSSLRYGVSQTVFNRLEGLDGPSSGIFSRIKTRAKKIGLLNRSQRGSSRLLTANQINSLYNALKRLMLILNEMSKLEEITYKGYNNLSNMSIFIERKKAASLENRPSLNTSASLFSEEGGASEEGDEDSPIYSRHGQSKEKNIKEMSGKAMKSFISLLAEEDKQNNQFQNFIFDLIALVGSLEAGGVYLLEALSKPKNTMALFKEFLLALEIWGSGFPLDVLFEKAPTNGHHQREAISLIRDFTKRWEKLISENKPQIKQELQQPLYEDLALISNLFSTVLSNLKLVYKGGFLPSTEPQSATSINSGNEIQRELVTRSNEYAGGSGPEVVGHLLPLSCGHNGTFSQTEKLIYEAYFKSANFMNS